MCHVMSGDPGADERVQPVPEGLGSLTQLRPLQVSQHSPHSPHSHTTHTSQERRSTWSEDCLTVTAVL